jgi:hypothetical protein
MKIPEGGVKTSSTASDQAFNSPARQISLSVYEYIRTPVGVNTPKEENGSN